MTSSPTLNNISKRLHIIARYWIVLPVIFLAVPLVAYAYMGTFMRYNGDDYCYAWMLGQNGFWKGQVVSYLQVSLYNGNRYSLTFFSGLADLRGPVTSGILPGLAVSLWILGLAFMLREITHLANISIGWLSVIFGAEFLVLMSLTQAPDLNQILYWRSGMLPYLAPLIAGTFLAALILRQGRAPYPGWPGMLMVSLLAILGGGFSETGFALQLTLLIMLTAGAVIDLRRNQVVERCTLWVCGAALMGTILAGSLLMFSPTNQARLTSLPPRPDLVNLVQSTLENIRIFSVITLKNLFISTVITFMIPFGSEIVYFTRQHGQNNFKITPTLIKIGLVLFLGFLSLCACFVPSAYIQSSYPELRALIIARFVMVWIISITGWLVGQLSVGLFRSVMTNLRVLWVVSFVVLAITSFYVFNVTPKIIADQPKFQRWALLWDMRDQKLRAASQQNIKNIEVMELDHVIPGVGELSPYPGYWYNQCAAGYYGVTSISANQPGWDQ